MMLFDGDCLMDDVSSGTRVRVAFGLVFVELMAEVVVEW